MEAASVVSVNNKANMARPVNSQVVLEVSQVSKKFCRDLKRSMFYGMMDIASELLGGRRKSGTLRKNEFWALKEVNFQLGRGEALGLVGPNGSGKTTLLRIISGLIKLDKGSVRVKGQVAPLIALGAGFSPILTGRENIWVNMSILGLSKKEISERFDEVVDFAEIEEAIDAPVQTYSSGMVARLGFACAIHTDPDILLIDEVLAVGDAKFRGKCYRKLDELRQKQISMILVSHNPEAIFSVCHSACYLLEGNLVAFGSVDSVMNEYEKDIFFPDVSERYSGHLSMPRKDEKESQGLDITSAFFRDDGGNVIDAPVSGSPTSFCVECYAHRNISDVCLKVSIRGSSGDILFLDNINDGKTMDLQKGQSEIQIKLPYLVLNPGSYTMKFGLSQGKLRTFDAVYAFGFMVKQDPDIRNASRCQFYQPRSWRIINPFSENV